VVPIRIAVPFARVLLVVSAAAAAVIVDATAIAAAIAAAATAAAVATAAAAAAAETTFTEATVAFPATGAVTAPARAFVTPSPRPFQGIENDIEVKTPSLIVARCSPVIGSGGCYQQDEERRGSFFEYKKYHYALCT